MNSHKAALSAQLQLFAWKLGANESHTRHESERPNGHDTPRDPDKDSMPSLLILQVFSRNHSHQTAPETHDFAGAAVDNTGTRRHKTQSKSNRSETPAQKRPERRANFGPVICGFSLDNSISNLELRGCLAFKIIVRFLLRYYLYNYR